LHEWKDSLPGQSGSKEEKTAPDVRNLASNNTGQDGLLAEIRRIDSRLIDQDHKISILIGNVTTRPQHRPPTTDPRNDAEENTISVDRPWVDVVKRKPKTAPTL